MRILLASALLATSCFGQAFGIWKVNPARSTFGDSHSQILTLRFEPHSKGEVFTLDTTLADGRNTSSSTILYFDAVARDFQDFGCSGKQSSRRVDNRTVEILRTCANGEWTKFVRRLTVQPKELILDVAVHHPNGRAFEHHLVLEKHSGAAEGAK